jgi:hypothetical protein
MGNVNMVRLWDEKMAQHGWKGGIALDKLKWVGGGRSGVVMPLCLSSLHSNPHQAPHTT